MKTRIVCATVCFLLMSVLTIAEEPVHFEDPQLKAAVEEALGVSDPTPVDMLALTSLNAESKGIVDLNGLESAYNLETLLLGDNQIADISPLEGLSRL